MTKVAIESSIKYPNRWTKGISGNPKGRPKIEVKIHELAKAKSEPAIHKLVEVISNPKYSAELQYQASVALLKLSSNSQIPIQYLKTSNLENTSQSIKLNQKLDSISMSLSQPLTKKMVNDMIMDVANLPYYPSDKDERTERFIEMSVIQIAIIKLVERAAQGDVKAISEMFNRILGRPKQESQNIEVSLTYQDYLDKLADKIEERKVLAITKKDYPRYANLEGI